jgi:hypothetical protein
VGWARIFLSSDDERIYTTYAPGFEDELIQTLYSADTLTIEFTLMQRNKSGGAMRMPWVRVPTGSYSLRIGLFDAGRAQLAYQNGFSDLDAYTKQGDLWLGDTAALAAVNAAPFQAAASFEVEITDSGGRDRTLYREEITFKKGLISASAPSVTPGEVAATMSDLRLLCVPKNGADPLNPNKYIIGKSIETGRAMMLVWHDDGTVTCIPA